MQPISATWPNWISKSFRPQTMTKETGFLAGGLLVPLLMIIGWFAGLIWGGLFVWNNAPVVGAEFWPYIRVVATIVGAIVAAKIGALVGFLVGAVVGFVVAVLS